MAVKLYTGTSGYSYKEWKGPFYPEKLPARRFLEYYSGQLPAVEVNNTFYRMPKAETLETWRDTVGDRFRFAIKASRRITHQSRLKDCEDSVEYLLKVSSVLGDARGPFLLQLPPFLKKDTERLACFLGTWPRDVRAAFEFRHPSWFEPDVFDVLRDHGAGLCIADSGTEKDAPFEATTDWGYLRLRRDGYEPGSLKEWATSVLQQKWSEAFVFFKHEDAGAGPRLAQEFAELASGL
ncbi:MAG: DUF72 domain-containing protein [Acidobacteriota bacterium]